MNTTVTRRLSSPKPPQRRSTRKKPPTPWEELRGFLTSHAWALVPGIPALWLALVTALLAPNTYAKLYFLAGAIVTGVLVWFQGHRVGIRQRKPFERHHEWYRFVYRWQVYIYAYAVIVTAYSWSTFSTFSGTRPSLVSMGVFVCLCFLLPGPWWIHRRVRASVIVSFTNLDKYEIQTRLTETQVHLIDDWTGYTSAALVQKAHLLRVEYDEWSASIVIRLVRGMGSDHFTNKVKKRVESASPWKIAPSRTRINQDDNDAQIFTIRYMLVDPHAEKFSADPDEIVTLDQIVIGRFETGAIVLFELVNTLIAGVTRAGKSNLINRLIQIFAKIPHVAILGADFTEGATEFRPWKDVMHALATDAASLDLLLDQILGECGRRGEIMSQHGWKVFRCTVKDPFMVFIIDEAASIPEGKLRTKVKRVTEKIGKYGGIIIIATQYPTAPNLPTAITVNLPQKIGLQSGSDTADRVIFGSTAVRLGFAPSVLIPMNRKGSYLILNSFYHRPNLARAPYISEEDVAYDVERFSPIRTAVGSIDLSAVRVKASAPGTELEPGDTIVEADIVDAVELSGNEVLVLEALNLGIVVPSKIALHTDIPTRTVSNVLRGLEEKKLVTQTNKRGPWSRI